MTSNNSPHKILIVDDHELFQTILEKNLKVLKVDVVKASCAEDALKHLAYHDIKLIFMDVGLPDLDGIELTRVIKANERLRHIPIIMISSSFDDRDIFNRSYQAGAIDFIPKTVTPVVLLTKVKLFLELSSHKHLIAKQALEIEKFKSGCECDDSFYRNIFNLSGFPVYILTPEGLRFIDANAEACRHFGYSRDELHDLTLYDMLPEQEKDLAHHNLNFLFANGKHNYESSHKNNSGANIPVEVRTALIKMNGAKLILCSAVELLK